MNKIILFFGLVLFSANLCLADDVQQVITLKDGSQIKGVLAGIENGTYTVKTPIIGDIHVAASDVSSITNGSAPVVPMAAPPSNNSNYLAAPTQAAGANPNLDQQVAASQQMLMSNPQNMALIQQMAQDPDIMQLLQDPALVQAVTSHNYTAVQSNPAVQKLVNNPHMQELLKKLAAQQQQQNQ